MSSQLPPPPPPASRPTTSLSSRRDRSAEGKGDALLNASQALEDLLVDGEEVIRRGSVAPQYISYIMWIYIVITVAATLACGVGILFAPFLLSHWLYLKRCRWYVTDRRILSISGLFSLKTEEIGFKRVGETNLSQGLLSRLFNTGTIVVNDIGTNSIKIPFVNNPLELKKLITARAYESQQVSL
jgi:membrane protein YdbS with pleckstrin-like domain